VLPGDIQGSFVGENLVLAIKGTTDSITIQNFRSTSYNPVQQVRFTGNATIWDRTQMITEGLRGTSGADKLIGTGGNDTFSGSAGNDTMLGNGGDDTYYFGRGEGTDVISQDYDTRTTRLETLTFKAGVLPSDIQGAFVGSDLVLTIKGTTDSIAIQNFRSASYNPVQQVRFTGSSTVWDRTQMITEGLRGTSGAESLIGTAGNDTFSGSAGNDTMLGNGGDDTYYFGRGEGKDLISQDYDTRVTRAETLIFKAGVLPTDVQASLSGSNLVLAIKGTVDAITVQNFKSASYNPVQQVRFANGTSWNQATLRSMVGLPASAATAMAANQLDQLVNAMASFAAPTAAVTFAPQDSLAQSRPIAVAVG
jgi:Ca2+-binding RTX toxin-like protein